MLNLGITWSIISLCDGTITFGITVPEHEIACAWISLRRTIHLGHRQRIPLLAEVSNVHIQTLNTTISARLCRYP